MKWKAILSIILLLATGCAASKEEMQAYYNQMSAQNQAILTSIKEQGQANRAQMSQEMQFFANAASNAAQTATPADDTLVAFAWGYRMGQPRTVEIPKLPQIQAPVTDVDRVRAWTPIVGMAVPFLYPLAYGWGNSQGSTYTATDQGRININSQNPGSGNYAGGNQEISVSDQTDNKNCDGCDLDDVGGVSTQPVECTGFSDAVFADGTWWVSPAQVGDCSCSSAQAGSCS